MANCTDYITDVHDCPLILTVTHRLRSTESALISGARSSPETFFLNRDTLNISQYNGAPRCK